LRISASIFSPRRIESCGGLVEQHQNWVVHQRLRELDALLHPGRVTADLAVALLEQPDVAQRVGCTDAGMARRQAAGLGHVREKLCGTDRRGQAVVLGHVSEPCPDLLVAPRLLAENLRAPGGWPRQTEEKLDSGALAGAVRAEQTSDGRTDLERNTVKGSDRAVLLGQILGTEQRVHARIVCADSPRADVPELSDRAPGVPARWRARVTDGRADQ
jgi:hypothetical protein